MKELEEDSTKEYAKDAYQAANNLLNIKVFEGLLRKTGAHIEKASSGKQALELTIDNKYDIIFLDYMMPEMDGIE